MREHCDFSLSLRKQNHFTFKRRHLCHRHNRFVGYLECFGAILLRQPLFFVAGTGLEPVTFGL